MASSKRARGNAPGEWFVDDRCINCGAARHIAPDLIAERHGQSVFRRQPEGEADLRAAWLAVGICPTRSVRNERERRPPREPYPHELAPGVYLCGFNARASYGAHSYLVERADGNLLVDSPAFTSKLRAPFEERGGIARIILSHRDDVADAGKWASHFGAEVYIHRDDADAAPYATHLIDGSGPDEGTSVGAGLQILPIPGHTRGSVALLVDETFLFSGDSLCWSRKRKALHAFPDYCWYSWPTQTRSLRALAEHPFEQVFPGHGSWSPRLGADEMRQHLLTLVAAM